MFPGNHNDAWKNKRTGLFRAERLYHHLRQCRSSVSTVVPIFDPDAGMSISAYVLNGSRGCSFNEWRKSVATNRNSVEHEAERETLPFLLPFNR